MSKKLFTLVLSLSLVLLFAGLSLVSACTKPSPTPTQKQSPAQTLAPITLVPSPKPSVSSPKPSPTQAPSPTAAPLTKLKLASIDPSSGHYAFFVAEAKAINESPYNLQASVLAIGGTPESTKAIGDTHLADFGQSNSVNQAWAYYGVESYKGTTWGKDLRFLWVTLESPVQFIVTEESGVTSLSELHGRKFGGYAKTSTQEESKRFLEANGIYPDWYESDMTALVEGVANKRIIGFNKAAAPDANILQVQARTPIRFLPLTQQMIDKANEKYPGEFILMNLPAGTYSGQDKDIPCFVIYVTQITTKSLSEDVVYRLAKAVYEKRKEIAASYGSAKIFADWVEPSINAANIPFHPGVVKLMKELGYTVPANLMPPG